MTGQLLPARSAIAGAVAWGVAVWAGTGSRDLSPEARFTITALAAVTLLALLHRRALKRRRLTTTKDPLS